MAPNLDILNADATNIQAMLAAGEIRSVQLVEAYLGQINKHNTEGMGLRAFNSLAPSKSVLAQAQQLDEERKKIGVKGSFHGIPIVVKVRRPPTSCKVSLWC